MIRTLAGPAIAIALTAVPISAAAQPMGTVSDADYIARVKTAAPLAVVQAATIIEVSKSGKRTLQSGTNGFTCAAMGDVPVCADRNALAWMRALATHAPPPDSVGFAYMLAGDSGDSNTDPYAASETPTNHWVKTGPHVMIFSPDVKSMGYPTAADADPTKPYVMWANTPYAHLMIPVTIQP